MAERVGFELFTYQTEIVRVCSQPRSYAHIYAHTFAECRRNRLKSETLPPLSGCRKLSWMESQSFDKQKLSQLPDGPLGFDRDNVATPIRLSSVPLIR